MKDSFSRFLGVLGVVLLFVACADPNSGKSLQAEIFPLYTARYDASARVIGFRARFHLGKGAAMKIVKIDPQSFVRLDGVQMVEAKDSGATEYFFESPAPADTLDRPFEILYRNSDGQSFLNQVRFAPPPEVAPIAASLSRQGFEIRWSTSVPLRPGERIVVALRSGGAQGKIIDHRPAERAGVLRITADELASFGPGPSLSVDLCREWITDQVRAASAGGEIAIQSCTGSATRSFEN